MLRILAGPEVDWSSWVLLIERFGEYRTLPVSGKYFPSVVAEIANADRISVFRGDGLLYRTYQRVYTYPKTIDFPIDQLPQKAVELMWRVLKNKFIRQYRNQSPSRIR